MEDEEASTTGFLENMFKSQKDIDGLLCIDNISGVKAVGLVQRLGKKVPKDISVIGFSSDEVYDLSYPRLSTVTQHANQIGRQSVKMLIDRLENKDDLNSTTATIDFSLDLRGTTL
jgi:LacI family transcriptional regulator